MPWEVDIGIVLKNGSFEHWMHVNDVLEGVDEHNESAGTGFGCRDMQWRCLTLEFANALRERLLAACKDARLEVEYCSVYRCDDEGYQLDENGNRTEDA